MHITLLMVMLLLLFLGFSFTAYTRARIAFKLRHTVRICPQYP